MVSEATLEHCSINQWTVRTTGFTDFVTACRAEGIRHVGLWRQNVAEVGLQRAAQLVREAELSVTTLCRGGFFTSPDPDRWREALEDNRRAIEEAVVLAAPVLVLVPGGLVPGQRLVDARHRVAEAVCELAGEAERAGVRLAIEPMHPMFAADRGVVSTIDQALDLALETGSSAVGVVVDTYHVWWDPQLLPAIRRVAEAGRLHGYQVADWCLPLHADPLTSRGYMGDGHVDFASVTSAITRAGHRGPVEVEIFNEEIWAQPVEEALRTVLERFESLVLPHLAS